MIRFFREVDLLRYRSYPYLGHRNEAVRRTAFIANALVNRADALVRGGDTSKDNWGFRSHYFTSPQEMLSQAKGYLDGLDAGEAAFDGLFGEPGACTVDHCFIESDGVMHVFYCRGTIGYSWPERSTSVIGHATTTDFIHYQVHQPAVAVRKDSRFPEGAWAPAVILRDGKYYMFYTGINSSLCQAPMMAVSEDLTEWRYCEKEPLFVPGSWSGWAEDKWSDCRDIAAFQDEDGICYLYYASVCEKPQRLRPAIGIIRSEDLLNWEDLGPILLPNCKTVCESPFILKKEGKYYLFYSNIGVGTCYLVSDRLEQGWETPENDLVLEGATCSEVFSYRNRWYISFVTQIPNIINLLGVREFFWGKDGFSVGKHLKERDDV